MAEDELEKNKTGENVEGDASAEYINIRVVGQDNSEVHFKIKHNTAMMKLMKAFCTRYGINRSTVRFLHDGQKIGDDATPNQLGMEDGDTIEVFQEQDGGIHI